MTSASYNTGNCGWYGCRVAKFIIGQEPYLKFEHGKESPHLFEFQSKFKYDGSCVEWEDMVTVSFSTMPLGQKYSNGDVGIATSGQNH